MNNNINNQHKIFSLRGYNIMSSLLEIINYSDINDINYVLAMYLISRIEILDQMSIYDVIDDCFVSRSTIHRFVKSIGFESFKQLKENVKHMKIHSQAFIDFAGHSSFKDDIMNSMENMLKDINNTIEQSNFERLVDQIKESPNVVILNASTSSSTAKEFQFEMTCIGKLIKLITSLSADTTALNSLTEKDLLITCSASGNYAITTKDDIKDVKAHKVLVTLNHASQFKDYYDTIIYLSNKFQSSEYISNGMQNIYTRYGINYFYDLLFSDYVQKYYKK